MASVSRGSGHRSFLLAFSASLRAPAKSAGSSLRSFRAFSRRFSVGPELSTAVKAPSARFIASMLAFRGSDTVGAAEGD